MNGKPSPWGRWPAASRSDGGNSLTDIDSPISRFQRRRKRLKQRAPRQACVGFDRLAWEEERPLKKRSFGKDMAKRA